MTRLRVQLVALLVAVTLLPALLAIPIVSALFDRSLATHARWQAGLEAGLASTRALLDLEKERFASDWEMNRGRAFEVLPKRPLELAAAPEEIGSGELAALRRLLRRPERVGNDLVALALAAPETSWIRRPMPAGLSTRADSLAAAIVLAQGLKHERARLERAFLATFLVANGVFLAFVILVGLVLANRLTRPLDALARGMEAVAGGDLTTRFPREEQGALGRLASNFNEMASRLGAQQADLLRLEKEAAWRDMARRLAHEIKNPLTPIQLAADEIRGAFPGGDPKFRALLDEGTGIIREEVDRLRRLAHEFSRFARMPEPRCERVQVASLLSGIGALYGPERVEIDLPPAELAVECDPEEIHRLLVNLVNNGIEAEARAAVAAPIRVAARAGKETVVIEVQDRGPGVPPADRERIFEPGVTGRNDGMGLGLAIVRSIAQSHGGQVSVEDRDGGGATFTLVIPLTRRNRGEPWRRS